MIEARFIVKERPDLKDFIERRTKGLQQFINSYVFDHIGPSINEFTRGISVYPPLRKRTGRLGSSLTPIHRKVNQYTSDYGFYFDDRKINYVRTHVGTGSQDIEHRRKQWLSIPVGRLKNNYNPRPSPLDFKGQLRWKKINESLAFWIWRKGPKTSTSVKNVSSTTKKKSSKMRKIKREDIAFVNVKRVRVPRSIDIDMYRAPFEEYVNIKVKDLAESAVRNFMRRSGGWLK